MSRPTFIMADTHFCDEDMCRVLDGNTVSLRAFSSVEEHDECIIENWNKVVPKDAKVYLLGDIASKKEGIQKVARLNGSRKILIRGNHDIYPSADYLKYFKDIRATHRLTHPLCNGILLSHFPIHPMSLGERAHKLNVHGHIHDRVVTKKEPDVILDRNILFKETIDRRYYCVSAERIAYTPIDLEILMDILYGDGKIGETIQV